MTETSDMTKMNSGTSTCELDSLKQINCQTGATAKKGNLTASRSTGTNVKRKTKSSRRRMNSLMNNMSIHFSDTDSEGELSVPRSISPAKARAQAQVPELQSPVISLTADGEGEAKVVDPDMLMALADSHDRSRRGSFVENLTDVDEIDASDGETEQKEKWSKNQLTVGDSPCQAETDYEDLSNDEDDIQPTIYVTPRSDLLVDFNGETITTKEGDGPFSVEIRNRMSMDQPDEMEGARALDDMEPMPDTDLEEMEASDDDDLEEASTSHQVIEDLDVLTASQVVMKNLNKMEDMLNAKEVEVDDNISDYHTDIEDVEDVE